MPIDPSTKSSEAKSMEADWKKITDIMAGAVAVRARGERYLPKYEEESNAEYERRRDCAPWRPEFDDSLRNLSSKPFNKDVALKGAVDDRIAGELDTTTKNRRGGFVDDVDGRGNNLTAFCREWFGFGIAKGVHVIIVDYPTMDLPAGQPITVEAEKAVNPQPYWVHVKADDIIALYTTKVGAREVVTHLRYKEDIVEADPATFVETPVEQVRVFDPGAWALWRKHDKPDENGQQWFIYKQGPISRGSKTLGSIPAVVFYAGRRIGALQVEPPLRDLAEMQLELYRELSKGEEISTYAGSPMLKGVGMMAPGPNDTAITVGPKRVLYAPPGADGVQTDWSFIQPAAANMVELRNKAESIVQDMRRLGMQPLMPRFGDITATATSVEAAKAHSAVQAWALALNDCIEQAFVFTCEWLNLDTTVQTEVSTDFSVEPYAQFPLQTLQAARAARDISRRTLWEGLRRFDVLPQDFDAEAEEQRLAEEAAEPDNEEPIHPTTGLPLSHAPFAFPPHASQGSGGGVPGAPGSPANL